MNSISPDVVEKILEKTFKDGYIFAKELVTFLHGILVNYIQSHSSDLKTAEKTFLAILDGIFSPRQIVKQVSQIRAAQMISVINSSISF